MLPVKGGTKEYVQHIHTALIDVPMFLQWPHVAHSVLTRGYRLMDFLQKSYTPAPSHQFASPCVYMRGPSRFGSSPRAQMLSVNTEIPERKQGFTAAGCTHSQYRQRPGARRAQPAPHKHRPPRLLSEPLVLLPDSGWAWFRISQQHASSWKWGIKPLAGPGLPLSACHRQEVNSYWLLNKWLQCVGVRGRTPQLPHPHSPSLDKHVLTEQLRTNPLGEILHFVPQAADKWNSYST